MSNSLGDWIMRAWVTIILVTFIQGVFTAPRGYSSSDDSDTYEYVDEYSY